jgi:hypothetical protein
VAQFQCGCKTDVILSAAKAGRGTLRRPDGVTLVEWDCPHGMRLQVLNIGITISAFRKVPPRAIGLVRMTASRWLGLLLDFNLKHNRILPPKI